MRRLTRSRTRRQWTPEQLLQLGSGFDYFCDGTAWGSPPYSPEALAEMRACWQANRERIIAEHAVKHPGERPWGWRFE